MRLLITRHGQSMGNIGHYDRHDPELTELGKQQASLLGERLSSMKLDCIISSNLRRALETANAVAVRQSEKHLEVELLPELMERGTHPGYAGLSIDELVELCPSLIPYTDPTPLGGRPWLPQQNHDEMFIRACSVIHYLRKRFTNNELVLVVAHAGLNEFLISAALKVEQPLVIGFSQQNTALSYITFSSIPTNDFVQVHYLNNCTHLQLL